MRKILLSAVILLAMSAWNASTQKGVIDKIVAVVGGEMILYSDIEAEITMMQFDGVTSDKDLHCKVLEDKLLKKLLLAQAKIDSISVTNDEVDQMINRKMQYIMVRLGGEKATEEYFHKPVSQIKKDWYDASREEILTQRMEAQLRKDLPVTPSDAEKFFKKLPKDSLPTIPPQYTLREIVILPPSNNAKFDVREQLLELRERILKGERFSTLATLYSEDPGSFRRGGELGMGPAQQYARAFAEAAALLKPGQVSPIVETEFGFHLIQMIEKESDDMFNVRHILLKPKYSSEDRSIAFRKLDSIADLVKTNKMTFEQAASRFSQEPKSNANGGLMVNEYNLSSRFEKDQLTPADYAVLRDMQQGDISIPFETRDRLGNTQYKIIQLVELIPSHTADFKNDYFIIQQLAKEQRQQTEFDKWVAQKQASTYIKIDEQFRNCKFEREGWIK